MTLFLPSKHGGFYIMKILSFTKILRQDFSPLFVHGSKRVGIRILCLEKHFEVERGDPNGSKISGG